MTGNVDLRVLTLPAKRETAYEKLQTVTPWFLRGRGDRIEDAAPPILTFTTATFVEDFFAGINRFDEAPNEGELQDVKPFEELRPFRDYGEPPVDMIDSRGRPLYPTEGALPDEAIRRLPPGPQKLMRPPGYEAAPAVANAVTLTLLDSPEVETAPSTGEAAGNKRPFHPLDDDDVPAGDPAWLRKLYLPLHRHFHLVTTEVVCRKLGQYPRLAKARVKDAGVIVRRLVPDADEQRWQDWIPGPDGTGLWMEIANHKMVPFREPPQDPPPKVDPQAIGRCLGKEQEEEVLARLGIAADDLMGMNLSIERLCPIPSSVGEAAAHTAFFGYVPLQSSELEAPPAYPGDELVQEIRKALATRAFLQLGSGLLGVPPEEVALNGLLEFSTEPADQASRASFVRGMRKQILAKVRDLAIALFVEKEPGASTVAAAETAILEQAEIPDEDRDQALEELKDGLETNLFEAILEEADVDRLAGVVDWHQAPNPWWDENVKPTALDKNIADGDFGGDLTNALNFEPTITDPEGDAVSAVDVLFARTLMTVLDDLADEQDDTTVDQSRDAIRGLSVALLLGLRAVRIKLTGILHMAILEGEEELPDLEETSDSEIPVIKVGTLSGALSAWLRVNESSQRDERPRPWPQQPSAPLPADADWDADDWARWEKIHFAGAEMESVLREIDEKGAGAGAAYEEALGASSDDADLAEFGLELLLQPERGLLVHPTVLPTRDSIEEFIEAVAKRYCGTCFEDGDRSNERNDDPVKTEHWANRNTVHGRFDSSSLYAVWCYVRVAGRHPCENEQILWTPRSDVFSLADPMDVLGMRPVPIQMPDYKKIKRDIPRIPLAGAMPFADMNLPTDSGVVTGEDIKDTGLKFGLGEICSFGIPVFTICAWIAFTIIFSILKMIPGFTWLPSLKFCIPLPKKG